MKFNEPNTSEIKAQKLYREMGLTDSEFDLILDILKRDPNYTETGIFLLCGVNTVHINIQNHS